MVKTVKSIVWTSARSSQALKGLIREGVEIVTTAEEFLAAPRDDRDVSFLDGESLAALDAIAHDQGVPVAAIVPRGPVVALCEEKLQDSIGWLPTRPWLAHVMSTSMLEHPLAAEHLANLLTTLASTTQPKLVQWIGKSIKGRRVRLAHSNKRAERLERMGAFLEENGVGSRTVQLMRDAAEELLTNAFYDAPVAAGASPKPISRTQEVVLPDECACDMVYGCRDDLSVVRVRDPFGSLTRDRLLEVLARCARSDMQVQVDESMGGAGLGIWRVFAAASFVAISVVEGKHTDFLVGIAKRGAGGAKPFAFHLFFRGRGKAKKHWTMQGTAITNITSVDKAPEPT